MGYERLSAADAAFLHIETDHEPQHVGSFSLIEGAPLRDGRGRIRIEDLRAVTEARLHRVPRLRQRLSFPPLAMGPPVWVDDEHFDIDYHVRLTALPRPGDDAQLHELMGRLQSLPLDRSRPLWELWFIDGLAGDRVGLVIKTHHALGDGIANVDLAMALVDFEPDPPPDDPAPEWAPEAVPSSARLLAQGLGLLAEEPLRLAQIGVERHPRAGPGPHRGEGHVACGGELRRPAGARPLEPGGQRPPALGSGDGADEHHRGRARAPQRDPQRRGARGLHRGAP